MAATIRSPTPFDPSASSVAAFFSEKLIRVAVAPVTQKGDHVQRIVGTECSLRMLQPGILVRDAQGRPKNF
jgi:hypothetical protein